MILLVRSCKAWRTSCLLQHEASVLLNTTILDTDPCKASYKQLIADHRSFLEAAWAHPSKIDIQNLVASVDALMKRLLDKASIDLTTKSAPSAADTSTVAATASPAPRHSCLKLDLSKFSGDLLDWREFWCIFSARLDKETDLPNMKESTAWKML